MPLDTVIETARLRLREFREKDLDDLARLNADPRVTRFLATGKTLDRAESWRQIATILGHKVIRGYTILAIEDRVTGQLIGRSGPWFPEGWPMLEVGWVIDPDWQGQGLATEAGQASLAWCREHLPAQPICSLIQPDNVPSARVAEKLGARIERRIVLFGAPVDVWVHA